MTGKPQPGIKSSNAASGPPSPYRSVFPRLLGAPGDSALTLVAAGQGAHLDLGVAGSSVGGAAARAKGPPGAWKAQGAGQGAQHLGAGWEGAKSPSTARSAAGESSQLGRRFSQLLHLLAQSPQRFSMPLAFWRPGALARRSPPSSAERRGARMSTSFFFWMSTSFKCQCCHQ